MLLVRSPLRITLGGGGSDVLSYSNLYGGFCISAAISKYSYVGINHTFDKGIILKYSETERIKKISDIRHPIFKEALKLIDLKTPQIEIVSLADVPSNGIGLGGSGSFSVALLKALYAYKNIPISSEKIAEIACAINIFKLNKIQGKQDEYISALGGIAGLTFDKCGAVEHKPLQLSHDTIIDLEENLMLFYTGINHDTESILSYQDKKSNENDMIENLNQVKYNGECAKILLEKGRVRDFSYLLNDQWRLKEERMPSSNDWLDELHYGSLENGSLGSKIVGSGMGGLILCYAENKNKLRQYMRTVGLEELQFTFDFEGCKRMV